MRKFLKFAALPVFAVAMLAVVPVLASVGTGSLTPAFLPPTADSGECHAVTNPTIPPASQVNPGALPGTGSQPWAYQAGQGGQVGIKGSNGFLVVQGDAGSQSVNVQGRLNAADLNGQADVTPNNASNRGYACISATPGNNRVRVQIP